MPKGRRDNDEKHRLRPAPTWRALFAQQWRLLEKVRGAKTEVLASAGVPKQTAIRATDENSDEPVSHDVFERLRVALNERTSTPLVPEPIPPPFVAVEDPDDWLWVQAGRLLRSAHPQRFAELLEQVQMFVARVEAERESERRLRAALDPASAPSLHRAKSQHSRKGTPAKGE